MKDRCNQLCQPMPMFLCDREKGHADDVHSCGGPEGSIQWWYEGDQVVTAIESKLYEAIFGKKPEVGDVQEAPKVH